MIGYGAGAVTTGAHNAAIGNDASFLVHGCQCQPSIIKSSMELSRGGEIMAGGIQWWILYSVWYLWNFG